MQLREEIEMKILKKSYLYDIIKREIWDSMTVKYKTIMVRGGWKGGVLKNLLLVLVNHPLLLTTGPSHGQRGEELSPQGATRSGTDGASAGSEH